MNGRRFSISRLLRLTVLYIAAGAITTIVVAWGFVFLDRDELQFAGTTNGGWIALPDGLAMISISERDVPGSEFHNIFVWSWLETGSPEQLLSNDQRFQPAAQLPSVLYHNHVVRSLSSRFRHADVQLRIESRGWPLPALWCAPFVSTSAGIEQNDPVVCGIVIGEPDAVVNNAASNARTPTLPMIPLWGGFAVDVMVFAFVWFVLITFLSRSRRLIRARRGRCSRCGYVMKDQATEIRGCPECGFGRDV